MPPAVFVRICSVVRERVVVAQITQDALVVVRERVVRERVVARSKQVDASIVVRCGDVLNS